jgi:hypothetical protein
VLLGVILELGNRSYLGMGTVTLCVIWFSMTKRCLVEDLFSFNTSNSF